MLSALEATVKSTSPHASRQWTVHTGARVRGQPPEEPPFSMQPMSHSLMAQDSFQESLAVSPADVIIGISKMKVLIWRETKRTDIGQMCDRFLSQK